MPEYNEKLPLNNFSLKIIACVTMLIDHIGAVFFPGIVFLRVIGRIAMPIYCFFIAEGAVLTRNKKKYLGRMLLFALLSEIPFNLIHGTLFNPEVQSVMITLSLGLICIYCTQYFKEKIGNPLYLLPTLVAAVILGKLAEVMQTDYGYLGLLMVMCFYLFRGKKPLIFLSQALINSVIYMMRANITTIPVQVFAIFALIPIFLYNGKKGPSGKVLQYGFYAFYPVHLLVIGIVHKLMIG